MSRRPTRLILAALVIGNLIASEAGAALAANAGPLGASDVAPASLAELGLPALVPTVTTAVAFGESIPVSEMPNAEPPSIPAEGKGLLGEEGALAHPTGNGTYLGPDPVLQTSAGGSGIPPTSQNFEGVDVGESSSDGVFIGAPPDTNGDVGPNHYVQTVNTVFSIWSKTGTRLAGPIALDNLWASDTSGQFNCMTQSRGDPVVQYDPIADRWLISQFNFPGTAAILPPFDECIAISKTPDPTGAYYLYDFRYSETVFNDYPHFGVWPDGYYMSVNQFDGIDPNHPFLSAGACAFERTEMLVGNPAARQVCFDESAFDPGDGVGNHIYGGQLPSDLDGVGFGPSFSGAPPAGEPNFFLQFLDSTTAGADRLLEWKFHVDWANPLASTFGDGTLAGAGKPIEIPVADFDASICSFERSCVPQLDSPDGLDAISDRLMYRLAYRRFADHESLVLQHTVNTAAPPANHAGIRWYELRSPNTTPTVHQQSTWAPDAEHRWMGSIAMDQAGDIALGYSLSSSSRNPAIAYTGRLGTDPLNAMTLGEAILYQGLGAQTGTDSRWGDYSSMSVDPNGCTFWYTTEHQLGTGEFNWGTRIGSFTLPVCGDPQVSLGQSSSLVRVRSDYSYTIAVTTGQSAALGVSVSDVLPASVSLRSVTTSRGSCQGTATVVCQLGDLPAGALETIALTVHAGSPGLVSNSVTLSTSGQDPNPSNNVASLTAAVYDPCLVPGAVLATDPGGDQTGTAQQDVTSVALAEPDLGAGVRRLVFTMKVQNLSPVPQANSYWYVHFSYGGVSYFVDMETATDPLVPTFGYGRFDVDPTTGLNSENPLGTVDSGTFGADGTIVIGLDPAKLIENPDPTLPPDGTPPAAGSLISGVHGETRTLVGVLLALADSTAGGAYIVSGNDFCATNTAPTAGLTASPATGTAPLTVALDASTSSDPDAGDTIASYTFTFGDGSTPVSQGSPTISHTYQSPGTYHATVTVTDSRGQDSTSAGSADVTVNAPPSADLSVTKVGPATGHVGQALTYTITVRNNGPSTAFGVSLTDSIPKNAGFGSATSTQGTCSPKPQQQIVTCSIGTMASNQTVTITIVIKPTKKGDFTEVATVTLTSPNDPISGNNTASVTTRITP